MTKERIKRGWQFDRDIIDAFDRWMSGTRLHKNDVVQAALWSIMHLDGSACRAMFREMDARTPETLQALASGDLAMQSAESHKRAGAARTAADGAARAAKPRRGKRAG